MVRCPLQWTIRFEHYVTNQNAENWSDRDEITQLQLGRVAILWKKSYYEEKRNVLFLFVLFSAQ